MLTESTSGLWGEQLKRVINDYEKSKEIIHRPYRLGICPTAPEAGGAVMERGFYPEQIIMALWNQGLAAWEIRTAPTSKGLRGLIKRISFYILPVLERLTWIMRQRLSDPVMKVVAVKPHQTAETILSGISSVKSRNGARKQNL